MKTEDNIINYLSKKGYRITQNRIDIVKCLLDDNHGHTINEIVSHLRKKDKKINVSSVYNTIEILIDEGIVDLYTNYKIKGTSYEIINNESKHIHVYDPNNKKEHHINLPEHIFKEMDKLIKNKLNLEVLNLKVEVLARKKDKNNDI
ncbi:MAG: Fur family transcriptional regulator [Mycoplasmoidaceae bacterium]